MQQVQQVECMPPGDGLGSDWQPELPVEPGDDVLGYLPRYAVPNISSLLPAYTNAEQDVIHRTFHTGNYDYLKHLPDDIKYQQVLEARTARMEAARTALLPSMGCSGAQRTRQSTSNTQGLFKAFEYQSSPFDLEQQLDSRARVRSEAKRIAVGGHDFVPAGTVARAKHQDLSPSGPTFPYVGGPYEATDEAVKAYRTLEEAKQLAGAFVPPGTEKLTQKPTRQAAREMMNNLRSLILKDWEACSVSIFENETDCWVVRVGLEGVDSTEGLRAYMNVLARCNPLLLQYHLVKVPEFWHTQPGDGGVYYMLRPPWVRPDGLSSFYSLHPDEKTWSTSQAAQEMARRQQQHDAEDGDDGDSPTGSSKRSAQMGNVTVLNRDSRLKWGVNFLTGTPATAAQGRGFGW